MAASLLTRLSSHSRACVRMVRTQPTETGYYVVLPEVPADTPDTNKIMCVDEYPTFSEITPDSAITGCAKLAIEYDVHLGNLTDRLAESSPVTDFKTVFDPLERISVPLNYAWKVAKNLSNVYTSSAFSAAFQRIHPQVYRAKLERWRSTPLYEAVKELSANSQLNEYQSRLVQMYISEAQLNGLDFPVNERKLFLETQGNLTQAQNHFRNRATLSHKMFSHDIYDFSVVADLPKSLLHAMAVSKAYASRGPWKLTMERSVYEPFLEFCSDRTQRWNAWHAMHDRASKNYDDINLSNHKVLEDIRTYRRDIAKLVGCENYAELSVKTKMAASTDNVFNMIDYYKSRFQGQCEEELGDVQEFARSEGFEHDLEQWDVPYWRNKHKQHVHNAVPDNVAEFFPFEKVLTKLFDFTESLFGIKFQQREDVETWHSDVRFFDIVDSEDGRYLSSFFLDPYHRPEKRAGIWAELARERSEVMSTSPLTQLHFDFTKPSSVSPVTLLSVDQAAQVFFEFGHALQQLLTEVPYSELASQKNVELDSLQTCAKLMKMLFLHPQLLASFSCHYRTETQLSEVAVHNILSAQRHMAGYDMMHDLYIAALDLEMNISEKAWQKVAHSVWESYMPLTYILDDSYPCSMTPIFSDQYPAAYYSFKWSEMIAADLLTTFEDAGLNDMSNLQSVGRRFRETYLGLGGGVSAGEVFRRFQGRDPSQNALVSHYRPLN